MEEIIEYRTKGAILRSKTQWYNEGEKNKNFFKSRKTTLQTRNNRPFQLVHFVFPFQTTWYPHGNFPFVFSLVMRKFARA